MSLRPCVVACMALVALAVLIITVSRGALRGRMKRTGRSAITAMFTRVAVNNRRGLSVEQDAAASHQEDRRDVRLQAHVSVSDGDMEEVSLSQLLRLRRSGNRLAARIERSQVDVSSGQQQQFLANSSSPNVKGNNLTSSAGSSESVAPEAEPESTTPESAAESLAPETEPESATPEAESETTTSESRPESVTSEPESTIPEIHPESATPEAEPESTTLESHTESATPEAEPESTTPESTAESVAPETEPESTVPEIIPESATAEVEPESKTPDITPEAVTPETEPDSTSPETHPESTAPESSPESATPEAEPASTAPERRPESVIPEAETESTNPQSRPESVTAEAKPESTAPESSPESATPEEESESTTSDSRLESVTPESEPESTAPETHPESATPEAEPESSTPETTAESVAPETEPESTAPETHPESATPEAKPESSTPESTAESVAPETEPESTVPEVTPGEAVTPETEPESTTAESHPESATSEAKPESTAPESSPESATPEPEPESTTPGSTAKSVAPETESESATPERRPESVIPEAETESTNPQSRPESTTPEAKPESAIPESTPESATPEAEPESTAPESRPESATPEAGPESTAPESRPESATPESEPESSTPESTAESVAPETEPESTAPESSPESVTPEAEPESTIPESSPESTAPESEPISGKPEAAHGSSAPEGSVESPPSPESRPESAATAEGVPEVTDLRPMSERIAGETTPEPEQSAIAGPEPEPSAEPESGTPSAEPEHGCNASALSDGSGNSSSHACNTSLPEPKAESSVGRGGPEPVPNWPQAKDQWKGAWPAHTITFSILFGAVSIFAYFLLVQHVRAKGVRSKPTIVLTYAVLICGCVARVLFLTINPYESQQQSAVPDWIIRILQVLVFPCLVVAYSSIWFNLYRIGKSSVKVVEDLKFYRVAIGSVTLIVFIAIMDMALAIEQFPMLARQIMVLVCSILLVIWGSAQFLLFLICGRKLISMRKRVSSCVRHLSRHDIHTRNQKEIYTSMYVHTVAGGHTDAEPGLTNNEGPITAAVSKNKNGGARRKSIKSASTITTFHTGKTSSKSNRLRFSVYLASLLGLLMMGMVAYSTFGMYGVLSKARFVPAWPWLAYQTGMRIVELLMSLSILYFITDQRSINAVQSGLAKLLLPRKQKSDLSPLATMRQLSHSAQPENDQPENNYQTNIIRSPVVSTCRSPIMYHQTTRLTLLSGGSAINQSPRRTPARLHLPSTESRLAPGVSRHPSSGTQSAYTREMYVPSVCIAISPDNRYSQCSVTKNTGTEQCTPATPNASTGESTGEPSILYEKEGSGSTVFANPAAAAAARRVHSSSLYEKEGSGSTVFANPAAAAAAAAGRVNSSSLSSSVATDCEMTSTCFSSEADTLERQHTVNEGETEGVGQGASSNGRPVATRLQCRNVKPDLSRLCQESCDPDEVFPGEKTTSV
ncbi:uncharacterized protein LOC135809313 [Sycon ciliatum]|uniref:uncharacterized protein LOC135809313 n=1 Tax=Sycon ciliatum TaxID=27933 RepID=UPI0031F64EE2